MKSSSSIISLAIVIFTFTTHATAYTDDEHKTYLLSKLPNQVLPKVEDPYEPKGRTYFVEFLNTTVYDTYTNESATAPLRTLIAVHDVFGPNDHIRQIADTIAAGKSNTGEFRVVVPDFFRGGSPGSWEAGTNADVRNVINYFQRDNGSSITTTFGIFGFCWGGRISVKAGQELSAIRGAGLIHPAGVLTDDAYTLQSAALLLPAANDPDMDPFEAIMINQAGIDSVFHRRFTDVNHGFAGATGNWSIPLINQRVDQVISFAIDFFNNHL